MPRDERHLRANDHRETGSGGLLFAELRTDGVYYATRYSFTGTSVSYLALSAASTDAIFT
ncbi:MAG: hypothetical protein U0Y68_02510 [Blastocatellia bacterium]